MSFFRKLFGSALREAQQAEAAGNLEVAAEKYVLAGDADGAVRMHMARAARAPDRVAELSALRDALKWAADDAELKATAAAALGRALFEQAKAEGIATERDRNRVREAAEMLFTGKNYSKAGEAFESIGDFSAAASAYSAGGLVEKLESAIAKDDEVSGRERTAKNSFASYEANLAIGHRDQACDDLRTAIAHSDDVVLWRKQLAELETKIISSGSVTLRSATREHTIICSGSRVVFGRDNLCEVVLTTNGVSRQHAELLSTVGDTATVFRLADLQSRNGTKLGGLPLLAQAEMQDSGTIELGDDVRFDFSRHDDVLALVATKGRERGTRVLLAPTSQSNPAPGVSLARWGIAVSIAFRNGRPWVTPLPSASRVRFGGQPLSEVSVQLIRGDLLDLDDQHFEVM